MTCEEYLWRYHAWEGIRRGDQIVGCCPLHLEQSPSFSIYLHDDHWCCRHENRTGDLAGLVNILEFQDVHTPQGWLTVFDRVRALHGERIQQRQWVKTPQAPRPELPYASQEQRVVLTAAMHWWHAQLWSPAIDNRGRAYFRHRGTSLPDLRFQVQLGYAPAAWQSPQRIYQEFAQAMQWAVGDGWEPVAQSVGILSKRTGGLALQDRVVFCSINELGECLFFQSRQVQFNQERPKLPYMSATGIRKVPFTLALPHATSTLTHVESPFGVTTLAPYDLAGIAHHGGPSLATLEEPWMRRLLGDRTQVICMDNDAPHQNIWGGTYYPGEQHAQVLQTFFDRYGYRSERILPPAQTKGLDEWIRAEGIDPFLQRFLAHTH